MIDALTPEARAIVARARARAAAWGLEEGLRWLDRATDGKPDETPASRVTLANVRAELLFLDGRINEALNVLEGVGPVLAVVETQVRVVTLDNRMFVEGERRSMTGEEFYLQQDRRRLVGFHFRDEGRVLDADEAFSHKKFSESHRLYWAGLWAAYHSGSWRATGQAASRYGRQCLALGWFDRASFYAAMAVDEGLAAEIGRGLLTVGSREAIESTIRMVLAAGGLSRWRKVLCKLLLSVEDGIQDRDVPLVLSWLLRPNTAPEVSRSQAETEEVTWEVIARLSGRYGTAPTAEAIAERGLAHMASAAAGDLRRSVVHSMAQCAPALSSALRERVTLALVDAATVTKDDRDYEAVVRGLGHLAVNGDEALRNRLGSTLVGPGVQDTNYVLLMHSSDFGARLDPDHLNDLARRIAGFIRLQVQRVRPDEQAQKIPGYGVWESVSADQRLAVVILGGIPNLGVVVAHRATISSETLGEVLGALLDAVEDQDNLPANRSALIEAAGHLADSLDEPRRARTLHRLLPFALGRAPAPGNAWLDERFSHPLSPFKLDLGDDIDTRSSALIACARLTAGLQGRHLPDVVDAIGLALTDAEIRVRRGALVAAGVLDALPSVLLPGMLLSSRDGQSEVAEAGLWALSRFDPEHLDGPAWDLVRFAAEMASKSRESAVRRGAAWVAKTLASSAPVGVREALEGLKEQLLADLSFSVREAASGDPSVANGAGS